MSFFSLWPLIFLLCIPIIILMYILKQKTEDKVVSSVFLWEEVYKSTEASRPWERLRKNIMLLLQILIILFLIFSLMNPFLIKGGKEYENEIIVVDNTGSMNIKYASTTRFDEGINRTEKYIDSLKNGVNITLISLGKTPKIEIVNSTDKSAVIKKLKNISNKDENGDIKNTLSLVKSMAKQMKSYEALFVTDVDLDIGDINGKVMNLGSEGNNGAIDVVSHTQENSKFKVMIKVTNRGTETYNSDLSLYGEEKLLDVQSVTLKPKESKVYYFDVNDFSGSYFKGELSAKDMLSKDNVAYDVIAATEKQKILLVSDKNIFLEKVLNTISNAEVYKTPDVASMNKVDAYNLYVFDGVFPEDLPKTGNILLINPPDNKLFKVGSEVSGGTGESVNNEITNYVDSLKFSVEKLKNIKTPAWAQNFLVVNNKPGGFYGKYQGREVAVFTFDLHNTDLVLKSEFPVIMNNLCAKLIDNGLIDNTNFLCGDKVEINALPSGEEVNIAVPDGKQEVMPIKFPMEGFITEKTGIYKISQMVQGKKREALFSVNFPTKEESNLTTVKENSTQNKVIEVIKGGGVNLQVYVIIFALLIITVEWVLYIRGH